MKLSKTQKLADMMGVRMPDDRYIINKREKGQPRFFKCSCCGMKIDLKDSVDYMGAIRQWEGYGKKCYACGENLGTKKSYPCHGH